MTFRQVAAFCIDLAAIAVLAETFYRMRDNLFCEPCRLEGKNLYHVATIEGPTPLTSKHLVTRDLRSGMVDILAALVAQGVSEVEGVEEIDRGYERIDERLRQLGADITRV